LEFAVTPQLRAARPEAPAPSKFPSFVRDCLLPLAFRAATVLDLRKEVETMGALDGIRVLECGELVAAPYAAQLLGHLGADVVKIEPREGDPARRRPPFLRGESHLERSGLHLYLNQAKRSAVVDWSRPADVDRFHALVAAADALLVSGSPRSIEERGLTYDHLRRVNPRLVVTTITPFGMTGPRRDWAATELIEVAAGGWLFISPGALADASLPPLKAFGQQADFQGGAHGALATLGALAARERTGRGEHVDVAVQAAIASNLEMNFVHWTYARRIASRLGKRGVGPWGIIQLADGGFFVGCAEEDQWARLVDYIGQPEWARSEIFSDRVSRGANGDALMPLLEGALGHMRCGDAYVELQARRVPCSPVFDMATLLRADHLVARAFFVEVDHPDTGRLTYPGAPFKLSRTPWAVVRAAPRLGEHGEEVVKEWSAVGRVAKPPPSAARVRPLDGVRIADFCWVWAGPAATLQLALLGADVIRVERPGQPDITRSIPPFADGVAGPNRAGYFNQYNQQKRSIGLNLKHPEGLRVARELVAHSDVVTENFASGVMNRLGLGYEDLCQVKPDLIMISFSGYGATGPKKHYIAYGPVQVPMTGLASVSGYPGKGPSEIGIAYGDPNAALHAALVVLAALRHRDRTGEGQFIDMSQWESAIGLGVEALMDTAMNGTQPQRQGNRDLVEAPQGVFRCAGEDEWVAIACWSEATWLALARTIGRPDLERDEHLRSAAGRKRNEDRLEAAIAAWAATRSPDAVVEVLQAAGVPSYHVLSNQGVAQDEQLNAWGAFVDLNHPEVGARRHVGAPWRFSESIVGVQRPAPLLYADTDRVLGRLLGLEERELRRLREVGAIA
jgi:crotonobetainyl-CoA:carnitine CoA-transferase CaiB-like acyl-CoA transferase